MEMRIFYLVLWIIISISVSVMAAEPDLDLLDQYYHKDYSTVIDQIHPSDKLSEHLIIKTLSHVQLKEYDKARNTYVKLKYSDHLGHYDSLIRLKINRDKPFQKSVFNRLFSNLPADPTPNYVYDIWLSYLEGAIQSKDVANSKYLASRFHPGQLPPSLQYKYVDLMVKYQSLTSDNVINQSLFYPLALKYPSQFPGGHLSKRILVQDRPTVIETLTKARDEFKIRYLLTAWAPQPPTDAFHLMAGKALYQLKKFDDALDYFNRIPSSSVMYFDAYYFVIKNDLRNKQYANALKRLETYLPSPKLSGAVKRMYWELAFECMVSMDPSMTILDFVSAREISAEELPNSFYPKLGVEYYHLKRFEEASTYFKTWVPTEDIDRAKRLYFLHRCEVNMAKSPVTGYGAECFYTYPDTVYAAMLANQGEFSIEDLFKSGYDMDLSPPPDVMVLLNSGLGTYLLDEFKARIQSPLNASTERDILSGAWILQKIGQWGASMRFLLANGLPLYTKEKGFFRSLTEYFYPRPYWTYIQLKAEENAINPNFSLAIMREESTFNPNATSATGALGLMQIMPKTGEGIAKTLKIAKFKAKDLYTPKTNIEFGSHYLGFLSRKFGANPLWMAAGYNAGPNAAQRWKDRWPTASDEVILERIPYAETNAYAKRVLRSFFIYSLLEDTAN